MLTLPDVTLVIVDTICHSLARMAVEDSTKNIEFGNVIVFSDKEEACPPKANFVKVRISSHLDYQFFMWYAVPCHIFTSHFLVIQWDGFVINSSAWQDNFLEYDYIGAPWTPKSDERYNVGNGGFSLRSVKLAQHVARFCKQEFRDPKKSEDIAIGRIYGDYLRKAGFKYPNDYIAAHFSIEEMWPRPDVPHFGFHGLFNFPRVLNKSRLEERLAVIPEHGKNKFMGWGHDLDKVINETIEDIKTEGRELGYLVCQK